MFVDSFSVADFLDRKAWRVGVNQELGLVLRLDSLEITGACLSSKEERVVLYEINREPRDVGGLVMSLEDWMSEMKESTSMEWRRRKERKVGRGRGVRGEVSRGEMSGSRFCTVVIFSWAYILYFLSTTPSLPFAWWMCYLPSRYEAQTLCTLFV